LPGGGLSWANATCSINPHFTDWIAMIESFHHTNTTKRASGVGEENKSIVLRLFLDDILYTRKSAFHASFCFIYTFALPSTIRSIRLLACSDPHFRCLPLPYTSCFNPEQ